MNPMRAKPRANAGTPATLPPSKRLGSDGSPMHKHGEEVTHLPLLILLSTKSFKF